MSLWLAVDGTGRALATTAGPPVAADPWVNGLRYRASDSALYVQVANAPLSAPDIGGIARDDSGVAYVTMTLPSPAYYNNGGVLTDANGTLYGDTAGAIGG